MPITNTRQGYDVVATHGANDQAKAKVNGWLTYANVEVPLWVQEYSTGWAMAGSTAQSSRTRSFFAHNFQQVSFTISCQFPSQREMGDVTQLIRVAHKGLDSAMYLEVLGLRNGPTNGRLKGASQNLAGEGYVKAITRVHEKGVYSPELQFEFVIERLDSPASWADSPVTIRKLKSWNDIVEGIMAHDPNAGFVDDPNANRVPDRPSLAPGPNGELRPN